MEESGRHRARSVEVVGGGVPGPAGGCSGRNVAESAPNPAVDPWVRLAWFEVLEEARRS